jgi:hypothetical protein
MTLPCGFEDNSVRKVSARNKNVNVTLRDAWSERLIVRDDK